MVAAQAGATLKDTNPIAAITAKRNGPSVAAQATGPGVGPLRVPGALT